uniref:Cytochrome P450 n=1 Tax=Oryza rufipogon TaxID=4529 RepID=A0A0E0P4Z3_ORYRU
MTCAANAAGPSRDGSATVGRRWRRIAKAHRRRRRHMAASRRTTHDMAMHGGTKLSGSLAAAQWRLVRQGYGGDGECLKSRGPSPSVRRGAVSFSEAQDLVVSCFFDPIEVKKWLNVGTECCLRKAITDVHAFAMDIVRARRQSSSVQDRDDVLSRFVASDEHNDEVLRDIVLSFLIAGRETTSSGLSWFFWLLSSQPDVMACITNEVRAVRKATGTCPDEPFGRQACAADDTLPDSTLVHADWSVTYNAYAMGRLAAIWGEDCLEYRPERWLSEDGVFQPANPRKRY